MKATDRDKDRAWFLLRCQDVRVSVSQEALERLLSSHSSSSSTTTTATTAGHDGDTPIRKRPRRRRRERPHHRRLSLRSELACPPILPLLRPCSPSSLNSPPNGNASSSTLRSNSPSSSKWNTSLNSRGLFVREPRLPIISHEEEEEEDDGVQVQVPVEVEVGKTAAAMRRNKKKKKKKEEEEREAPMSPRRKRGCASVGSRLPPPPPPPLFRARIALLRPTTTPNSPPSRCSTRL